MGKEKFSLNVNRQLQEERATEALTHEVMTTGQVAALFAVNFKTVLRWAMSGKLKSSRLPGNRGDYRFLKTHVLEFADEHKLHLAIPEKEKKPLVLVVDDDEMIARSIERILHGICNVISAKDGYQAGVLMATHLPTLVFLDLQMPSIDGASLIKYMRTIPNLQSIPVCVVSGSSPEEISEAVDFGANMGIEKPFSAEIIRSIAAKLIFTTQSSNLKSRKTA
jgi:CheY-like chemotaxis protein